ncbi:NAD(P)/FAD-dependent oxidoreductase [Streptosporangium amethystogenes]|uniref:NAD(P)/FAD-dependent oxidoreductase n=1 Tax=Streptosporangium amethystogenes TaxID=2002 RepID=UPI0004C93599|nr:FAD-dependent oxidoreductase [Streptosporangium amethystogenes]
MPTMPSPNPAPLRYDPDVLVIGGGVVGLFCAYYLRRAGNSVTVVERGPVGGLQSCSYGNTGFVGTQGALPLAEPGVMAQGLRWLLNPESPFYIRPRPDPELLSWLWHFRRACNERDAKAGFQVLVDMKKRSLGILRELCASDGLASTFTAQGMLLAYRTRQGFEKACRAVPGTVASGVPLRVLGPGELRALEPDAEFDIHGALYNEEGAYLRVPDFVTGLARTLGDMGVEIHEHTGVVGFEVAGAEVKRVRTVHGDFSPRETVIAAGTWSAECARGLDIGLRLQPAKGYSVTVKAPGNAPRLPVLLGEGKVALVPLGDRLRFGGTLELSGMDTAISRSRVDGILRTVQVYLPKMESTETLETWSGFRPCSPDGLPFLGRAAPYRNLSVACGHGHIGMGLAPVSGRLIAQLVAGERPEMDLTPLSPGRYGGGPPRRLRLRPGR